MSAPGSGRHLRPLRHTDQDHTTRRCRTGNTQASQVLSFRSVVMFWSVSRLRVLFSLHALFCKQDLRPKDVTASRSHIRSRLARAKRVRGSFQRGFQCLPAKERQTSIIQSLLHSAIQDEHPFLSWITNTLASLAEGFRVKAATTTPERR